MGLLPKYFHDYELSNITSMIRNNRRDPLICGEDFRGRLVVITGATSGIGYHTARKFASMGARLLCINRNEEKSKELQAELEKDFGIDCSYLLADMGNLGEVKQVAEKLARMEDPIHVLVHNAGVHLNRRTLTPEGFDKVFMVNHLSSLVINLALKDKLLSQQNGRIILNNSEGHRFAPWGLRLDDLHWEKRRYSGLKSYGSAKLAQLQCMLVFDELLKDSGVSINAMHPGAVQSDTGKENTAFYRWKKKNFLDKMLRPTEVASESIYYLAVSEDLEGISGKFFNLTTLEEPAPPALDREAAAEIWERSLQMAGLNDMKFKKDILSPSHGS